MVTPNKQKINAARAATGNVIVLSAEGKILFFTADRESAVNRFLNAAASFEVYASCMLGSLVATTYLRPAEGFRCIRFPRSGCRCSLNSLAL